MQNINKKSFKVYPRINPDTLVGCPDLTELIVSRLSKEADGKCLACKKELTPFQIRTKEAWCSQECIDKK